MRSSRIRLIEIIVAVAVTIISVASLFVAVFQGVVMQRQLEASVLPIPTIAHGNYDSEEQVHRLSYYIGNRGLGPVDIRWLHFIHEGVTYPGPIPYFVSLVEGYDDDPEGREEAFQQIFEDNQVLTNPVAPQLLAPDDEAGFIHFTRPAEGTPDRAYWERLNAARWESEVQVCYCSVFDQCWIGRFPQNQRDRVRSCLEACDAGEQCTRDVVLAVDGSAVSHCPWLIQQSTIGRDLMGFSMPASCDAREENSKSAKTPRFL